MAFDRSLKGFVRLPYVYTYPGLILFDLEVVRLWSLIGCRFGNTSRRYAAQNLGIIWNQILSGRSWQVDHQARLNNTLCPHFIQAIFQDFDL